MLDNAPVVTMHDQNCTKDEKRHNAVNRNLEVSKAMSTFNLAIYRFSSRSDVLNETGIYLDSGGQVNTGRRDDSIAGTGMVGTDGGFAGGTGGAGISNSGTLRTEQGNDVIKG